jgi:hypothetical protein
MRGMHLIRPLRSGISGTSVWTLPDHAFRVYILMLSEADYKSGIMRTTMMNLQRITGLAPEKLSSALNLLSSPDPEWRSAEMDGRKIKAVQGGFLVINYLEDMRAMRVQKWNEYNTEKQREYRALKALEAKDRKTHVTFSPEQMAAIREVADIVQPQTEEDGKVAP